MDSEYSTVLSDLSDIMTSPSFSNRMLVDSPTLLRLQREVAIASQSPTGTPTSKRRLHLDDNSTSPRPIAGPGTTTTIDAAETPVLCKTKRGSEQLLYNNNFWQKKTTLKSGDIRWRCAKRKPGPACLSTMRTTADYVPKIPPTVHNHDNLTAGKIDETMLNCRIIHDTSSSSTRYLLAQEGLPYNRNIARRRKRSSAAFMTVDYVNDY